MQREPVTSPAIASLGYDPASRILEVEQKDGEVYQFQDVSEDTYQQLRSSPSMGQFYRVYVKHIYPSSRV